jgi:hypothetical protein
MEVLVMHRRYSRIRFTLTGFAVLGVMSLSAAPAGAVTRSSDVATSFFQFINNDGKCLDMTGGSLNNGTDAQQWRCNGNLQQYWGLVLVTFEHNGYDLIENYNSGKCLSILNNNDDPGADVIQYTCNFSGSDPYEDWTPFYTGTGTWFAYYNRGTCAYPKQPCAMHPSGGGTTDGKKITTNFSTDNSYLWKLGKEV